MKRILPLALVIVLVFAALPLQAAHADPPPSPVDQSFTSPAISGAVLNQTYRYTAQTFTAGVTGALTAFSVEIGSMQSGPLYFSIHAVTDGLPNATVLSGAMLWPSPGEPFVSPLITQQIQLWNPVYVVAGTQYAIVVHYDSLSDAAGIWSGALGDYNVDYYTRGEAYQTNDESFTTWTKADIRHMDLHFQTYVLPNVPTADLSIRVASKPRHAKACQTFNMVYRVTNNGPDTVSGVSLGIGLWDQFDAIAINGTPVGTPHPTFTLKPGESVLMTATIKVTAFVPGESRKGLISGTVWLDDPSNLPFDLNPSNDGVDTMLPLIGRQVMTCP